MIFESLFLSSVVRNDLGTFNCSFLLNSFEELYKIITLTLLYVYQIAIFFIITH
jgi:hypothetical protein